ncbi:MAG: reductive dehalogenase [Proteobacteria bacterium]|nr:reductive dehalogenase [Pseudomonadota bacterium]
MEKRENQVIPSSERSQDMEVNFGRRRFFKASAIGATLGVAALTTNKKAFAAKTVQAAVTEEHDEFPVKIAKDYKRFPQRNTVFARAMRGETPELEKNFQKFLSSDFALMGEGDRSILEKEPGWSAIEKALEVAAWAVEDKMNFGSKFGVPQCPYYAWEGPTSHVEHRFDSKVEASKVVKKAAKTLGASLVGITPYDERWTYDPLYNALENKDIPAEFPFKPKSVVVLALEMDYERMATAPSWLECSAVAEQYSRMATVGFSVATFLRSLGYKSFAVGNDVALSVPYAVASGLGEAGRNGIVLTYEYGPRVRLVKVFTELELAYDKPKTFGVRDFCERCQRCADACPGKAIPKDEKPSFKVQNKSNNHGVEKWAIDAEKCCKYWGEMSGDCGVCITSCPYNKPDFWHHKMVVWATRAAPGPLHGLLREMDIVFGYGNTFDKKALLQWWDKG